MHLLSGQELAARLRRARPAMKVAFLSGYGASSAEAHDLRARGFFLIPKPFSTSTLLARIREKLDE